MVVRYVRNYYGKYSHRRKYILIKKNVCFTRDHRNNLCFSKVDQNGTYYSHFVFLFVSLLIVAPAVVLVAPVAYQDILEPGIGQFREFEPRRVHTRIYSLGLLLMDKLTCGKRESVS